MCDRGQDVKHRATSRCSLTGRGAPACHQALLEPAGVRLDVPHPLHVRAVRQLPALAPLQPEAVRGEDAGTGAQLWVVLQGF